MRVGSQLWEEMATHKSLSEPRWHVEKGRGRPGQSPPNTTGPGLGTEGPGSRPGLQYSSGHKGDQGREHVCHFAPPRNEHDAFPPAGRRVLYGPNEAGPGAWAAPGGTAREVSLSCRSVRTWRDEFGEFKTQKGEPESQTGW